MEIQQQIDLDGFYSVMRRQHAFLKHFEQSATSCFALPLWKVVLLHVTQIPPFGPSVWWQLVVLMDHLPKSITAVYLKKYIINQVTTVND